MPMCANEIGVIKNLENLVGASREGISKRSQVLVLISDACMHAGVREFFEDLFKKTFICLGMHVQCMISCIFSTVVFRVYSDHA